MDQILIIDDDPNILGPLRRVLESRGHAVLEAASSWLRSSLSRENPEAP